MRVGIPGPETGSSHADRALSAQSDKNSGDIRKRPADRRCTRVRGVKGIFPS
ncbi:hypothetical protein ASZ90_010919 [hydrocarbon metagenome]|uniref:Uncharacterized protein n=1 Tax=hydrocarbon metagenome TaxID=938273 RepID=A0A0W8FEN0_9ZZZZ